MPGALVQTLATGTCSHGGQLQAVGTGARVLLSGQPAVLATDIHPIAACPFQIPVGAGTKPSPCVTAAQFVPATRVFVLGVPVALNTSVGVGKSIEQAPQGPASFVATQPRVTGM
jgi:hypothetical protein